MGHADHDISEAFSRFDRDGNQILDEEEQKRMKSELEEKRVCTCLQERINVEESKLSVEVFLMFLIFFVQDALSAEINNLGVNYEKDSSVGANGQRNNWSQTFVDREQFLRWEKAFFWHLVICDNIMTQNIFWLQDGDFFYTKVKKKPW